MKWVYKLERKFGRICIPHLMLVIIAGQAMVYLANLLNPDILLLSRFSLNWAAVMHGEVWRLLTFVFIRGHLGGCAHRLRHQLLHQPVAVFCFCHALP